MDTSVKKEGTKDTDEAMEVDEAKPDEKSPAKDGAAAVAASS